MVDAIVAAEDERYFSHGGVDPLAILRAAGSDLTGGDPSGASTITQQYVKNVYTNKQRTLLRKVKEAALAVRLDRAKSKQEILRLYLNSVYFGNNTYGIEAAAKFYFKKDSKQLDCGQAAMLAGLVSAPSAHEPVHHFADAKVRQHYVLDREVDAQHAHRRAGHPLLQRDHAEEHPAATTRGRRARPIPNTPTRSPPRCRRPTARTC